MLEDLVEVHGEVLAFVVLACVVLLEDHAEAWQCKSCLVCAIDVHVRILHGARRVAHIHRPLVFDVLNVQSMGFAQLRCLDLRLLVKPCAQLTLLKGIRGRLTAWVVFVAQGNHVALRTGNAFHRIHQNKAGPC